MNNATSVENKRYELKPEGEEFEKIFPIVDIENVSLNNRFMIHIPRNSTERRIMKSIYVAKKNGMKNFRKQAMCPSLRYESSIYYCAGEKPALGKSPRWWEENARYFMKNKNSRIINDLEKDVSLGVMIKELVEKEGYKVKQAWYVVCVNSKTLGHYSDSDNAGYFFEPTGSRQIGRWYDLGNVSKIVQSEKGLAFKIYGGWRDSLGASAPLAKFRNIGLPEAVYYNCVGEIRLDV